MAAHNNQQTFIQQTPIRYIPAEAYQTIPKEMIRDRVSLWSRCQQIDTEGRLFKVVSAEDGKMSVAVSKELSFDFKEVKRHFGLFKHSQSAHRRLNSQFLLEPQQTFLDQALSPEGKLRIWTVYEYCPYFLTQGTSGRGIQLPAQNVILEIELRHFLTALLELLWLFKNTLELNLIPNLSDYAIGVKNGQFKFLIAGIAQQSSMGGTIKQHPIFEDEQTFIFERKQGFNKLDIQKSSHRTAESFEIEIPEFCNFSSTPRLSPIVSPNHSAVKNVQMATTEFQKTDSNQFLLKFAVSVCYEMFKSSLLHSKSISAKDKTAVKNAITEAKNDQFKDLFVTFDKLNSLTSVNHFLLNDLIKSLQLKLQKAPHKFITFKDETLAMLRRPIYSNLRQVRFELSDSATDCNQCIEAIVESLNEKQFSVIELFFSNASLKADQMATVAESLKKQWNVRHLSINWPSCPTNDICIDRICQLLQSSTPNFIAINLNNTEMTPTQLEYLVNSLAALPPNTLQGFELSLCSLKNGPIQLTDEQLASFLDKQPRIQSLKLELTSVALDAQLSSFVAESIGEMTDLASLDIKLKAQTGKLLDVKLLIYNLSRLANLKSLSLHLHS